MAVLTLIQKYEGASRVHVMIESPIPPGLDGPYLVSSSKDLIWVNKVFPNGRVRAAVQNTTLDELFQQIVVSVAQRSRTEGWGSTHFPTPEGVAAAVLHLADYELEDVELIYGEGFNEALIPDSLPSLPRGEESWVPAGWAVVVPKDRAFVGTVFEFGGGQYAVVLHNAPRGVGVIAPEIVEVSLKGLIQEGRLPASVKKLYEPSKANRKNGLPAVRTLSQLTRLPRARLLQYHGVGTKTVDAIEKSLKEASLHLAES